MKVIRTFCLSWLLMLAGGVSAQLVDKVLSVLGEDSVGSVTVARTDSDSIQLSLVRRERGEFADGNGADEVGGLCGRFGETGIAETTH
jgi:hypothetical protein